MPELPEVETIARGLASRVTGDVIESVWLGSKPEPLKSPPEEIAATLESRRIAGVRRGGKHIGFDLDGTTRQWESAASPGSVRLVKTRSKGGASRRSAGLRPARAGGRTGATEVQRQTEAQWVVH